MSVNGKRRDGISAAGGPCSTGTNLPLPRGNSSSKRRGEPGWFASGTGHWMPPSRSRRSCDSPAMIGISDAISSKIAAGDSCW